MFGITRQAMLGGISVLSLAGAVPALAQEAPVAEEPQTDASTGAPQQGGVGDIIVTAQRRNESLQRTPIAITAFNADKLSQMNITNAADLAKQTPAFTATKDVITGQAPLFSIRGLGQSATYLQQQPSIAVYVDGVYATTSSGQTFAGGLFDVQRVEVLKGPQGTLFGRNSTGGAISVVSKLPTGDFEGEVQAEYGRFDEVSLGAVVNIPISGSDVGLRLVGQYLDDNGYGKDLTSGRPLNDQNLRAGRATFRAASGPFEVVLRGDYSKSNVGPISSRLGTVVLASPAVYESAFELGLATSAADLANPAVLAAARQGLLNLQPSGRYDARYPEGLNAGASTETYGGSGTVSFEAADNIEIKSITAWRRNDQFAINDLDQTPIHTAGTAYGYRQKFDQFTQELQLNGSAFEDKLRFATGLYYYRMSGYDDLRNEALPALNPTSPSFYYGKTRDISKAAYAQATLKLAEGVNLTGGIRYTDENVRLIAENTARNPVTGELGGLCVVPTELLDDGSSCKATFVNKFNNWSFTGGIDYQVTPSTLLYAKVSRGFKAGGNNQSGANSVAAFGAFKPEIATTYETGVKADLIGHTLRVNLAAYYTDFQDIQRTVYVVSGSTLTSRVENAATARVKGGELEITASPSDRVDFTAGVAYTDAAYKHYTVINPVTGLPIDRSGDPFPNVPEWTVNLVAGYTLPLEPGKLRFQVDASFQSDVVFDPANRTELSEGATNQDAYGLLNARINFTTKDKGLEFQAYVTNLTKTKYNIGGADLTSLLGFSYDYTGAPRRWGVKVIKRF